MDRVYDAGLYGGSLNVDCSIYDLHHLLKIGRWLPMAYGGAMSRAHQRNSSALYGAPILMWFGSE
jgi:hypothetical protein